MTLEKIAASSGRIKRQTGKEYIFTLPCKFLSYIVAHTFAIKMIYPGSVSVLNWIFRKLNGLLLQTYYKLLIICYFFLNNII